MKVITNGHRRELLTWHEIPADVRADFDYIDGDGRYEPRFLRYRGEWYDTADMMMSNVAGWDAATYDTFYSGVLVKFLEGYDYGFVVAATVYA